MDKKIQELIDTIDESIKQWDNAIPGMEKDFFANVMRLVKKLELSGDDIKKTVSNLRLMNRIKGELDSALYTKRYLKEVESFIKYFDQVEKIQSEYFTESFDKFSKPNIWNEIKRQTIEDVVASLTEADISTLVIQPVADLIRDDVMNGSSWSNMVKSLEKLIESRSGLDSPLKRYSSQIVTDAINQYAAQYNNTITDDLGLQWFQYVGSLVKHSRPFCRSLVAKRWVNVAEFSQIVKGKIDGKQVPRNPRTGLPDGMIPGTNSQTLKTYRGGYRCNHLFIAVDESVVPESVKKSFAEKYKLD
jgi:hypothetical protein